MRYTFGLFELIGMIARWLVIILTFHGLEFLLFRENSIFKPKCDKNNCDRDSSGRDS